MFSAVPFLTLQPLRTTRLSEINYLLIYLYLSKLNLSKSKRSSHNSENCVLAVYTKERITQRLIENRDNIDFEPFQPKIYRPKQYRLRTRSDRIGKVGGMYGLYLYYCYRLGYLPKYKAGQQNHARVHYLFKEDLMKIDELTKQVTLLGKHHIGTDEQLFSYQHSVEEQIKTVTADRTHLRNEIRKVNITDAELSQAKASISLLTEKLKELRKEVKLCQEIAVRSKVIEEKVDAVRTEEEKSKRKENRNYEQRR